MGHNWNSTEVIDQEKKHLNYKLDYFFHGTSLDDVNFKKSYTPGFEDPEIYYEILTMTDLSILYRYVEDHREKRVVKQPKILSTDGEEERLTKIMMCMYECQMLWIT